MRHVLTAKAMYNRVMHKEHMHNQCAATLCRTRDRARVPTTAHAIWAAAC